MSQPPPTPAPPRPSRLNVALFAAVLLVPVGIILALPYVPARGRAVEVHASPVAAFPPTALVFDRQTLGREPGYRPQITNVRVVDLDGDGRPDVLACDARLNRVFWLRQLAADRWEEIPLGDELNRPAGATPIDLDGDGDLDVVVAVLGDVYPTDERVGQVVWLENRGGVFVNRVLLDDVRRVSDVRCGDLDGDGDTDIAVAVFGYHHGEILWLENRGAGRFRDHLLLATQGPSHVPVADLDGDGDLDIAALVSQEHEEVWAFENRGKGEFAPRRLFASPNFDLGGAGLVVADLDRNGKSDLLLVAGDNLEVNNHYPQPWHGCLWLENRGGWEFAPKRIGSVGGVYAAAVADFDGDGNSDVVLASMFNDWNRPGAASLVLLRNDGKQNFTPQTIATQPSHLATVAAGDLNGDGLPEVVAGSLHLYAPRPDRVGRVSVWWNRKGGKP